MRLLACYDHPHMTQHRAIRHHLGGVMRVTLIAKDPESQPQGSPTLYRTDRGSWIVQGWIVTDPDVLAQMDIPQGEIACEIPDRLVPFFQET